MSVPVVGAVGVGPVGTGHTHGLGDDDAHDQPVNSQHTCHDNGDDVLDDAGGVVDAHVAHTEPGPPRAPSAPPRRQDHAGASAQIAAG